MTKILVAIMQMEIGGAETHVLELSKALQRKGMRVYVASNGGAYEPELEACGVVHYKVPLHNKQPFNIFLAYRALKRIIKEHDIRLVHGHARIPNFLCGFLQRRLNFRFVTSAHWVFTTKFPYNLLSDWGEKSLAVSEDIKEYLIENYKVPADDISITVNGIDTEKFSPTTKPVDIDYESEFPRIMSLSRLDTDRSLPGHLLIESAPELFKRYPNMAIYIVGDGNDFENLREKATKANEVFGREVIKMPGAQVNVSNWMALADVFAGSSRSLLEAMAIGKSVVAAGDEGYLGVLTEENLPIALATNFTFRGYELSTADKLTTDIVTILAKTEKERAEMGRFAREIVLANYSVDRMADDAMEVYSNVLATAPPVRAKKTDVMISGYYGNNNSGDDLLLKSIVGDLRRRQEDLSITVLSERPKETRQQYGVNAIYRFNFFAIWRLLRRTRLLLTGGGTLIQDLTSTKSLIYYLWIIRTAHRLGVKNMLYANGIGPINKASNVKRIRKVLETVELITLREQTANTLLENLNIKCPKVVVTADPVFSLPTPDYELAQEELQNLGISPGEFLCVSLRAWKTNPPGFEQQIASFCDYVYEKFDLKILFVPMQPPEDTEVSKKAIALMKHPAIFMESTQNMDSLRGIVGLSALTLAMRLHSLIYAITNGVPVIGLVYDPKVEWLMKAIEQPFYTAVEDTNADELIEFADRIQEDYESIAEHVREAGLKAQELARQNADLCMELLEE